MGIDYPEHVSGSKYFKRFFGLRPQNNERRHLEASAERSQRNINPRLKDEDKKDFSPKKVAFTLAEVLIVITVIGVVAGVTMPALIQNHKKHVVETRLKKFYTNINQAILRAESTIGDKSTWDAVDNDFFKVNVLKYLEYVSIKDVNLNGRKQSLITFSDGSAVIVDLSPVRKGGYFRFCTEAKYCFSYNDSNKNKQQFFYSHSGKQIFIFGFFPNDNNIYHKNKGVEPHLIGWNGNVEDLYSGVLGCSNNENAEKSYCLAIIQRNGWIIPKDYPLKF